MLITVSIYARMRTMPMSMPIASPHSISQNKVRMEHRIFIWSSVEAGGRPLCTAATLIVRVTRTADAGRVTREGSFRQ